MGAVCGAAGDTGVHAHHALQIAVGLEEGVAGTLKRVLLDPDTDPGSLLEELAPEAAPRTASLDPRVGRAIRGLKETGGVGTLAAAARSLGLSSSRLGHLFSAQVGLPFRPYALWLRLQGALAYLARGANLTEAAHGAGFADSAHLTRTFRRMFGVAPSDLAGLARQAGPRIR